MKPTHVAAIELLMSHPDTIVAEMLGIRLSTLRRWMTDPKFTKALSERESEQRTGAVRIARQAAINAASALCQLATDTSKPDAKALLEILKASGAFEPEAFDPADALAEVLERIESSPVTDND